MESDHELVDAWSAGDREAAGRLFDRHFEAVYRFFRTKADPQDVDDLVQATFVGCVNGKDKFRKEANVRTYLLAIARNRLHTYWRARSRARELDFGVSSVEDLAPSPLSQALERRRDRLLVQALRCVPLDMQIALELHYWEGMRGPELAEVLGIPEGTVRSRLRRGLEALRAKIAELAESSDPLASTTTDLEAWARSLESHWRAARSAEPT